MTPFRMEQCEFRSSHQRDLQSVHEGHLAGFGKIGWVKNRFKFDVVEVSHNLPILRVIAIIRARTIVHVLRAAAATATQTPD
jgi:hypothetical protein